jgi:hypothetical protein
VKKNFPKDAEIVELREIDDDWIGPVCGYFAKGLHDPQAFAIAVNKEFQLAEYGDNVVFAASVKVGYLRKVPLPNEGWSIRSSKPGNGAFCATYVFF